MKSLYERFASSDDGAQLLAATRLRREVLRILHRALRASGLTQSQVAERLRIRKSAVSQVFRGDGNLRVNTLAQYLSAMGYELDVRVVEAGEPRKAVLEGREMNPAFRQDWVESDASSFAAEVFHGEHFGHGYVHMTTSPIELKFSVSHLTTMVVEMRMQPGEGLHGFLGPAAEEALPEISPTQVFRSIPSGATS